MTSMHVKTPIAVLALAVAAAAPAAAQAAPTPAPAPPPKAAAPPEPEKPKSGFGFGSYGRMIAATDFKGRPGRDADIVARGSRLDESNYVELDFRRHDYWEATKSTTHLVATLGITNPIFHYSTDFDIRMGVRNLYIEENDLGVKGLSAWVGSRMYRGDDIYLLDWWPLDNLNTMGAGARYELKNTTFALHGGLNQPNNKFFLQQSQRSPVFNQQGSATVDILSRQRFIGSAKVTHIIPLGKGGIKASAYGELHQLPSGQRELRPRVFEDLPSDGGFVGGVQLGAFTGENSTHLNLFLRYASGLAAYGEFGTPDQLAPDHTSSGARELRLAFSGNWEKGPIGIMAAGYVRSFRNASPALDFGDVDEAIIIARPHVFFGDIGGLAVEGSYQVAQHGAVYASTDNPAAPDGPFAASLARFGVIPFISPAGRGDYSRPQFRLIYVATLRSQNAKLLYPQDDVFSLRDVEHFFGVGAEWWFNSSTFYGG